MTEPMVRRWLRTARSGHCGETDFVKPRNADGLCSRGVKGSFGGTDWPDAVSWCLNQCSMCTRCRHISVSLTAGGDRRGGGAGDCSWYARCARLRHAPPGMHELMDFRSGPMPAALGNRSGALPLAKSKAARMALRTPHGNLSSDADDARSTHVLPFFSPHDGMHVALCFFGKIGSLSGAAGKRGRADERVVRHAHDSFVRKVVVPNPGVTLDAFVHTWSPEVGRVIDGLYRPVWSQHEQTQESLQPAQSASKSLFIALRAKQQHEQDAMGGRRYDLVWALRCDLVFFNVVRFSSLPRAQLWFPRQCCKWSAGPGGESARRVTLAQKTVNEACLELGGEPMGPCTAFRYLFAARTSTGKLKLTMEGNSMFVNDWFFLAPSSTADSFAQVHNRFPAYLDALREVGITIVWLHFLWATHVHAIRAVAGTRPAFQAGVDFTVFRFASWRYCVPPNVSVSDALAPKHPERAERRFGRLPTQMCGDRQGRIMCAFGSVRCASQASFEWGS